MLKTLDRYIIRQFLGTFFLLLVLIMAIAVVFDISEKTGDFAKSHATTREIVVDYYVNFILYYANFFSGLFIFLAVLLFTSRLAGRSEVIAMLSGGVSFNRFVRPYMIAATFLAAISLYLNVFLLPGANRTRLAFEKAHIWNPYRVEGNDLLREVAPGVIVYVHGMDMPTLTATRMSVARWENGELRSKLEADHAIYDTVSGKWRFVDWRIRTIPVPVGGVLTNPHEVLSKGHELDTLLPLRPSDIGQRLAIAGAMDREELADFITAEKMRGSSTVAFYEVERDQRTAAPFATFVFTLIGVGVASRKTRGGTGVHLVLGVILILIYIFLGKLSTVAATNAGINAFVAVWAPNLIFALIAAWIYWKAPK